MRQHKIIITALLLFTSGQAFSQETGWKGNWIGKTEDKNERPSPLFRKSFKIERKVRTAEIRICGLGQYELAMNGKMLTANSLPQTFTKYNTRLLYQSYDAAKLLNQGQNALAVELGNGWYNMQSQTIWNFDKIGWRKSPRFILDLIIRYSDGGVDTIASDQTWKANVGAGRFNSMHSGEIYDARKEIPGWRNAGFNDAKWPSAILVERPGGRLEKDDQPAIKVIRESRAKSIKQIKPGKYLFDMGENFAGVPQITLKGKAGDSVIIVSDELLDKNGMLDKKQNSGQMIGPATDPKFQTDIFVCKGAKVETFSPRFSYHGFQYVEVTAPRHIRLNINSVKGWAYSTGFERIGTFTSSDPMLNKLYAAAINSYQSNFVGIPTDCPQREKMGWLADAHIAAELGLWNFNATEGYKAYLRDIRDVQLPTGKLPGIAPTEGVGYSWINPEDRDFGPAWGSALPLITWSAYRHSLDKSILDENYRAIKDYTSYLSQKAGQTGDLYTTGIADWQALESTPKAFTSTAIYYHDLVLASKMAKLLDYQEDSEEFTRLANRTKVAFNKAFFDEAKNSYKDSTLTALSASLYYGLCPEKAIENVAKILADQVIRKGYKADFGIFGTKYILRALSDHGYTDIAYKLLTEKSAGWGKWIATGSTTLWEEWPGTTSHNHVYSGDYAAWFFEYLGGIKIDEQRLGKIDFILDPVFPKGLNEVTVSHKTKTGDLKISWKREADTIALDIVIPSGLSMECRIKGHEQILKGGKYQISIKE